jgi:Tfp pilus assembly protein PilN
MATTMVSDTSSSRLPSPMPGDLRFVAVRANLMPDEVISARQAEVVRRQIVFGLAVIVVALLGWFGMSWFQTVSARSHLQDLQRRGAALQNQQDEFRPLVSAQLQVNSIETQLHRLMVGDLSWKDMLTSLRGEEPAGVSLTNVTGTVTSGAGAAAAPGAATGGNLALNQTGKLSAGALTISGQAPDKNSVATYADRLARVKGLTGPLITNVTAQPGHSVTFSVTVIITSDALGGRYSATPTPTGGK